MSKLAKVIAWLALLHGVATLLIIATVYLKGQKLPTAALVIWSTLGTVGLVAGIWSIKAERWAFWVLFLIYLIQIADYWTPNLFISFMGPISVKFGWGWYSPPSHVNLNLLAIAGCIFTLVCARGLTTRSSGPLRRGVA